jgi:hypothetical protein
MSDNRQKRIEQRAYEIWEREGRRSGMDAENWRRAEAEIAQEEAEASTAELAQAEALTAEPEPAASAESVAEATEPAVKAKPAAKARTRAKAKPAEPMGISQVQEPGAESKASEEEIQEKTPRKRKTTAKKK